MNDRLVNDIVHYRAIGSYFRDNEPNFDDDRRFYGNERVYFVNRTLNYPDTEACPARFGSLTCNI
jgi:hypothetical protein